MCFGGGDDKSSKKMIKMQEEEARLARQKEAARQQRITGGLARIKGAFEGTPVMKKASYNWGGFNPKTAKAGAVPGMAGFKFVNLPAAAGTAAVGARPAGTGTRPVGRGSDDTGRGRLMGNAGLATVRTPAVAGRAAVPGRAAGWYVQGPDGKVYKQGDVVSGNVATGKTTGGIGDPFYNKFKQGILDYYTPQVAEKYGEAKNETNFRLARAGTLNSTAATQALGDLVKQNALRQAEVRTKADTGAADLRSRVASERAKATSQLYATENPEVAGNQALAAIRDITSAPPDNTALGDIFNIAAIGGAKYLQGARSADLNRKYVPGAQPASHIVK